ncbi:MAG: sigma-70 family RNA polymerase sigma factor [Lachnospiraceae bacterium]|nr:sigma-70 family RNA polymerase sigma factor [Lachnospiraceae bacterium]
MLPLNNQERLLVEEHLNLVEKTIYNNITINESIQGMGYDDLYQIGCEALCHAAQSYKNGNGASFATFAKVVIYNRLISHCRKVIQVQNPLEYMDAPLKEDVSLTLADTLSGNNHNAYSELETFLVFNEALQRYHGICRKGLYALHLRNQGHSYTEIASYFNTKPNHITAWIAKAVKKARADHCFNCLS